VHAAACSAQPIGSHRPDSLPIDVFEVGGTPLPHPRDFWKDYIEGHKPALFRGFDTDSRAAKLWDEEYLKSKFGWVDLKIEPKMEVRGDMSVLSVMDHRMNVSEFLPRNLNENIYGVSIMPYEMAWDVNIPSSVMCGGRRQTFDAQEHVVMQCTRHRPSAGMVATCSCAVREREREGGSERERGEGESERVGGVDWIVCCRGLCHGAVSHCCFALLFRITVGRRTVQHPVETVAVARDRLLH
jgi:hypothetical protein